MSDSDSDIMFESADEGEELTNPPLNSLQNSHNDFGVERLHHSNQDSNAETEIYYKIHKKERTGYSYAQETNICNVDVTKNIENIDDLNFNRKIPNDNEKELKITQDSNRENVARGAANNEDLLKSKYTEDTFISEKKAAELIEKVLHEDKVGNPEYSSKLYEKQAKDSSLVLCNDDSSNSEKQIELAVEDTTKSEREKPVRVVLKFEKKLTEKLKHKNISDITHKKQEFTVLDATKEQQTSSWGWENWGSSLLSTAASSMSAFTSQVSEGFGTVLGTVESTLGAPPPEELAAAIESRKKEVNNHNETKVINETDTLHNEENSSGLLDGVSSLSKVIENTGSKVLMTGLDTLELIGKTTIDILTEGDPGLRKKRAYFTDTTNLSEVLREAKDKAEAPGNNASEIKSNETIHYSTFLDNFQGIVHLEALEMLSRQHKTIVQGLVLSQVGKELRKCKERMNELEEICENLPAADDTIDEESHHEFIFLIKNYISKLELDLSTTKLEEVHKNIHKWLKTCQKEQNKGEAKDAMELHHEALKSMAQLTAHSVELFHKVAEMLLYKSPDVISALSCASCLIDITGVLCFEIGILAAKFCQCLNTAADDSEDPDSVLPLITNVYLEASNSNTYIQDAFQLLVPILQVVAIKQTE